MKASKYIFALLSAALICSCNDKDSFIEEEQNPTEEVQEISFVANISDANTRVAYAEQEGALKLTWEGERTVTNNGETKTIPGDFIFVYTDKEVGEEINLENDWGYGFVLSSGEGTSRGKFVYSGKKMKYKKTTKTEQHQVDTDANGNAVYNEHDVVEYTVEEQNETFPTTFSTTSGKCQARWEHPLNSAGECQASNGDTEHLKYQEVMTAEVSSANFITTTNASNESETQAKSVVFTHPKTVVFKLIMNQFLYSIHQGSHVGILGVDENGDEVKIDGVYLQKPEKYFAYDQTTEPEVYLTVTPTEGDPCGYGTPTENLVTYIMVETSKLALYKKFVFAVTDNWSHDLYTWSIRLKDEANFESGQYYTVDLTSRTCLPALHMGGPVLWAVKNLGAETPYDDGLIYRFGDQKGITAEQALEWSSSTTTYDYFSKDNYDTTNPPIAGQTGWATAIINLHNSYELNETNNKAEYRLKDGVTLTVPSFLEYKGTKVIPINNDDGNSYDTEIPNYILKPEYDVVRNKYGNNWRIPQIGEESGSYSVATYNENGKEGFIQTSTKTQHKLFYKSNYIYKDKKTVNSPGSSFIMQNRVGIFCTAVESVHGFKISEKNFVSANIRCHYGVQIRPVRTPLHTMPHVSGDEITGVTTEEEGGNSGTGNSGSEPTGN